MKNHILSIAAAAAFLLSFAAPLSAQDTDLAAYATEFMKEKGRIYASPKLVLKTDNLSVFSDSPNKAFVVLAESKFKRQLGDIVLAYSMESALNGGSDEMVYEIIGYYDAMLSKLRPTRIFIKPPCKRKRATPAIEPMLRHFAQGEPYNKFLPVDNGNRIVAGCGPTALAQILYYHGFPQHPEGTGSITLTNGSKSNYDLSGYTLNYDGSEDDIARVVFCAAASMYAKAIGPKDTQTAANDFKGVLVGKWGYSPGCTHVKDCDESTMADLLFEELDNKRPVIVVQTNKHTFCCDGRDGSLVHLNFGWGGYCDGWYRIMLNDSDKQRLPFKEMIIGITPGNGQDGSTAQDETQDGNDISITEPGTLASILGEEHITSLRSVKVSGPLNGDDIITLRRMAGAVTDFKQAHGSLMDMDLTDAQIVAGGAYYNTRPCYNMTISGYYKDGSGRKYFYDMSKISDADWQDIISNGLENRVGCVLSKGSDGKYYSSFFTENNIMGKYMFEDCENLINVKLPLSITEMRSNVFLNCRALKSAENVPEQRDPNAFKGSGLQGVY